MLPRWASVLLCLCLLSCCYAQGEAAAMGELRASWSVQGWNATLPYCQWPGVSCAPNTTNVNQINLAGLPRVGGTMPSAIGNLTSLQHLYLSGNVFYGSLPTELALLTQIQHLDLSDNYFSGPIPSISAAPLTYLNLSHNFFNGNVPSSVLAVPTLATCDLTSNPLTNCSGGDVSGAVTCQVTCAATSQVVFTGPCGVNPILSPSIISNCTNGTGYVTVVDALSVPGSWSVAETLVLQVNASVTVAGSLFFQSASNISLSAPITVMSDFIVFPNSNVSLNVSAGVQEWVTSQDANIAGCVSLGGNLIIWLAVAPPSPLLLNFSQSDCYLTGFANIVLAKVYRDNLCFTSEIDGDPIFNKPYLQVQLKDHDCATKEKQRLIIFGSVFGGIGLLVTICIVLSLGCIRQRQRREGLLIDDQL